MKSLRNNHHGFFFSYDALVALSVLFISFVFIMGTDPPTALKYSEYEQMHSLSEDAMQVFAATPASSVGEPLKSQIKTIANLTDEEMDKGLLDIVGILWGINSSESRGLADSMTQEFFRELLGNTANYSLAIDGDVISNLSYRQRGSMMLLSSSRAVSGYKQNSPKTGFVARAYIAGARKATQSYAYFGGFEGNGDITKMLALPESVDVISDVYIEMDTPSNFTLKINGAYAGSYNLTSTAQLRAKNWTVPQQYYSSLVPGANNITLDFSDINSAYVGGGFIRVKYNTTIMDTTEVVMLPDGNATDKFYFPGIDGVINIYSSMYAPGDLKSMGIRIHYLSNYTVYLILGNITVYENSTDTEKTVYLNNTYLKSLLNYSVFSTTVPIRFGTRNITGMAEGSDVVLITDLSGSMSACDVNSSVSPPDCNNPGIKHQRLYSAKESDREFVSVILGNPGQKVGLIAYDDVTLTSFTVNLTDNSTKLNNTINSYNINGMTCISCGIKSAMDMLATTMNTTVLISNKSWWYYNDSYLLSEPPPDSQGRNWTHVNYSLGSQWTYGYAVFGNSTSQIPASYLLPTATNISANGSNIKAYPDLWDMAADRATLPVDFTSGMNSTANTFGLGAGDDGWDSGARYDYDNTRVIYFNASGGKLVFSTRNGTTNNNCATSSYRCSGGYGIQINITSEQYAILSSGGTAYISLEYSWKPISASVFEIDDEVWIKGNWTSPTSGRHPLGTEISSAQNDVIPEIANGDHPYFAFTGNFIQNITSWIEGPGTYYLDFGGKLYAAASDEGGNFSFDNVLLEFSGSRDVTYFRKNFTISNINSVGKGIVKILSDDSSEVYINGASVSDDGSSVRNAKYWNAVSIINRGYFRQGENIIAVKLYNGAGPSRFDLELVAVSDSRNKAMLVMSDGDANTRISGEYNPDTAPAEAINYSCSAYERYGIISHAVGFGNDIKSTTLQAIAECGRGTYSTSSDEDELKEMYRDIANSIISYTTQAAEITGETLIAKLYTDSFIEYNYTPAADIRYGDLSVVLESDTFGAASGNYSIESPKNGSYNVSSAMVVIDAKATSYSSDYWTSTLETNSTTGAWRTAFNLSNFGKTYTSLGDPFIVNIPVSYITPGEMNYVRINTAKNSSAYAGGSPDDRVIYTVKVKGSVDYGEAFPTLEEARANATWRLTEYLESLGISATQVSTGSMDIGKIPWMWGPSIMTLEVWK